MYKDHMYKDCFLSNTIVSEPEISFYLFNFNHFDVLVTKPIAISTNW